jgi:hypothetical protein
MHEIKRDEETGLVLVVDQRDPPRYYIRSRKRIDLVCIGNARVAANAFDEQVQKAKRRKPPSPS